jgi:competence CoiA-like predicted nuclease
MSEVITTRIDNFVCPACGEIIRQVIARDGVVKGWCHHAKKEIKVVITPVEETIKKSDNPAPLSFLDSLKQQRAKVLKDVVSAREDGDLKENSAYHAAREQLSILDDKILKEEAKIRRQNDKS